MSRVAVSKTDTSPASGNCKQVDPTRLFTKALRGLLPPVKTDRKDKHMEAKATLIDKACHKIHDECFQRESSLDATTACTSETEQGQPAQPWVAGNHRHQTLGIVFGDFPPGTPESRTPDWTPRPQHEADGAMIAFDDFPPGTPLPGTPMAAVGVISFGEFSGTPEARTPDWTPRQSPVLSEFELETVTQQAVTESLPMTASYSVPADMSQISQHRVEQPYQLLGAPCAGSVPVAHPPSGMLLSPSFSLHQAAPTESGSWYHVAYLGGLELRAQPSFVALRTGVTLHQNEMFHVSQDMVGADGRIYLLLSDGRGWAFDDSALIPHDPSVLRIACTPGDPQMPSMPSTATLNATVPVAPTSLAMFSELVTSSPGNACLPESMSWRPCTVGPRGLSSDQFTTGGYAEPASQWNPASGPPPWNA